MWFTVYCVLPLNYLHWVYTNEMSFVLSLCHPYSLLEGSFGKVPSKRKIHISSQHWHHIVLHVKLALTNKVAFALLAVGHRQPHSLTGHRIKALWGHSLQLCIVQVMITACETVIGESLLTVITVSFWRPQPHWGHSLVVVDPASFWGHR